MQGFSRALRPPGAFSWLLPHPIPSHTGSGTQHPARLHPSRVAPAPGHHQLPGKKKKKAPSPAAWAAPHFHTTPFREQQHPGAGTSPLPPQHPPVLHLWVLAKSPLCWPPGPAGTFPCPGNAAQEPGTAGDIGAGHRDDPQGDVQPAAPRGMAFSERAPGLGGGGGS